MTLTDEETKRLDWLRKGGAWGYDDQEFLCGLIDRLLAAQKPPEGLKCAHCERRSIETTMPISSGGGMTQDGFFMTRPTCNHGEYVECPDCRPKYKGCPVCGCQCEYT